MPIAIAPSDIVGSPGVARVGDADAPQPGLFDGQPVADGDVVVRLTYLGGVNLGEDIGTLTLIPATGVEPAQRGRWPSAGATAGRQSEERGM
jgi:hypothetical protein